MLPQPYVASWCDHAMSICCQYALNAFKNFGGTKKVSVKNANIYLWKKKIQIKKKGDRNGLKLTNMWICLSLEVEDSYESLVHTKRHNFQKKS